MGKGSNKTTTQTTQSYTPDPQIRSAGYQALAGAQSAAELPFQMPAAPVAGFSPFQQQAFNQIQGMQGMSLPYFDEARQYMRGSASPISEQDIGQYYNPMAQNVTNQLQNIFGQQNRMATANAVRTAGGVGADRIGVAQGNLANQQGLAAGQIYSGLYDKALAAAQQQRQMMAGTGFGIGQLGPAAQASFLQGTGALGQAGAQQQALQQAQQNALYQQRLAEIAYPFQTPQYLAGITGGLAPALGGTTQGQSVTTQPQPSPLNQILGIGGALLGTALGGPMGGALGGSLGKGAGSLFGGGTGTGMTAGYGPGSMSYYGGVPYYQGGYRRGGKVIDLAPHEYAEGGSTYGRLAEQRFANSPVGNPYASDSGSADETEGYAEGGDVEERPMLPGTRPLPLDTTSIVPKIPLRGGAGHAGANINLRHAPAPQSSGSNTSSQVANIAGKLLPMLMAARGGPVNPFDAGMGFQDGGDIYPDEAGFQPPMDDIYPNEAGFQTYGSPTREDGQLHSAPPISMLPGAEEPAAPSATPSLAGTSIPMEGQSKPGLPDFSTNMMPDYPSGPIERPGGAPGTGKPNYGPFQDRVSAIRNIFGGGAGPASAAASEGPEGTPFADRFGAFQKPSAMQGIDAPMGGGSPFGENVPLPRRRPDIAGPSQFSPQNPPLSPQQIAQETIYAANKYGIPQDMALRLIRRESNFRNIRGDAGEYGPAQLMPGTAREMGVTNPMNTYENIHGGMRYLKKMYDQFGNWPQAIAAYNAGPNNVAKGVIPASTRAYVADVSGNGTVDMSALSARERGERGPRNPFILANQDMTIESNMRSPQRPYPDATQRDWGQNLARSPWGALIVGGARMAQTVGPVGSALGAGIEAGMGHLSGQRKELRTEEDMNMKADALFQHAKTHLDKYQRMTPYESEISRWREATNERKGMTAHQRDAQWYVDNGIAPDLKSAVEMLKTGVNTAAGYARMVEAAKKTILQANPGMDEQEAEVKARERIRERGALIKPQAKPMPTKKEDLEVGERYATPRGEATWDGEKFVT